MIREGGASGRKRVLFFNMPWGPFHEPSLGLGILKRVLTLNGVGCDVVYAGMRALRYITYETWIAVSKRWAANDFIFTSTFEEASSEQWDVLRVLLQDSQDCLQGRPDTRTPLTEQVDKYQRLREYVIPRFLEDLITETDFSQYSLVGFSCLFDQTIPSLALARRIKRIRPNLMVAFGGYALQPPVGPALQQSFANEMDVIAYGDGEPVIVPLWEASCGLRPLREVPNISFHDSAGRIVDSDCTAKINLDCSPAPDYDDFFLERERMESAHGVSIRVGDMPVESSRGCWYGQKSHCIFCGIDDETLRFRVKQAEVTIGQLDQLHRSYNVSRFRFCDYIMPFQYFHDFLPEMARRGAPYRLHYETKANLKQSQIALCAQAGIRFLQPGIETFDSSLLRMMGKGVSAAHNVYALYSMFQHGIYAFYNILFGIPFESVSAYEQIVKVVPCLSHLVPPQTTVPLMVTRYSPIASQPERFGANGPLKAHWRYDVIFSRAFRRSVGLAMEDYCYYYDSPYRDFHADLRVFHDILQHQILRWRERFEAGKAQLSYADVGEGIDVRDTRFTDTPKTYRFGREHRLVGEILRSGALNRSRLVAAAAEIGIGARETETALNDLTANRIVLEIERQYVWLPLTYGNAEPGAPG